MYDVFNGKSFWDYILTDDKTHKIIVLYPNIGVRYTNRGVKNAFTDVYLYFDWLRSGYIINDYKEPSWKIEQRVFLHPVFFLIHTIHWKAVFCIKKILGHNPIKCTGCGQGISEYTITNPNWRKRDKWFCCADCVEFYDFKATSKKIGD